ncbi:MAG: 16S rRNA (adenine(1518)-N(6)/adenine(1519)-N(6))-dimethyltransferase RsmA [Hyphomicrobiales bacterium]|nr:16S rRNA (adenine(1518)-N(6)/adenine(1519)-N(6))-dimethyltransferase RsmA [Hyphomicrobiales bacterium]MDE2113318.1 16S rRNA (adenine(1518)-N(6)/adenine(1519)-N(6))-dimethyltransferase RsmA [Hyphomicrobiales bacterium]
MNGLDQLPPLRDVVARFEIAPKKSLGQNFLFDLNLTRKIARAAGPLEGLTVIEVGPGPGGLTRALLMEGAAKVIAIEPDTRCLAALAEIATACPGQLEIIAGDALALDMMALASQHGATAIVANLPYNVGTALLVKWLEADHWPPPIQRLVLMFQREVAERIVATPQQRADYGRLSVLCGWRSHARILFDVPASAFTPPPKITSSVVELVLNPQPLPCQLEDLVAVTKAAFAQRRKMLRQSLKGLGAAYPGFNPQSALENAGILPSQRAEEVPVEGFVQLARQLPGRD